MKYMSDYCIWQSSKYLNGKCLDMYFIVKISSGKCLWRWSLKPVWFNQTSSVLCEPCELFTAHERLRCFSFSLELAPEIIEEWQQKNFTDFVYSNEEVYFFRGLNNSKTIYCLYLGSQPRCRQIYLRESSVIRAFSGCLGTQRLWRTWYAAISVGELRISFDPTISEWGNPP